jgi:hypothetical protein
VMVDWSMPRRVYSVQMTHSRLPEGPRRRTLAAHRD